MEGIFAAIVLISGLILRRESRRCRDKGTWLRLHVPFWLTDDDDDCPVDFMTAERQRFKMKTPKRIVYCRQKT